MYEDILLPTDGSESMDAVVEHTIDIATRRDATVHVLYVVDDRAFLTLQDEVKTDVLKELEAEGEAATATMADRLREAGVDVRTELRKGDPADVILDYTQEADVDLVTMGTHGTEYERNMLGSVSQKVVTVSSIPVLTVNIAD
ncbi:universal stress protein [Salinirarus marinus]|uniref:universal stress protein n=1 Tax=Salinirarus marinus TaxID=3068310 RepID=UPI003C6C3CCA